jgi:hypothetical protein
VPANRAARVAGEQGALLLRIDFGADNALEGWEHLGGSWRVTEGAVQQESIEAPLALLQHEGPVSPATISTRLRVIEGSAAGLLFDIVEHGASNAHLVRFTEDGSGLIWGWIERYGQFREGGFVAVPPPGDAWHLLEIVRREESYSIQLDGRQVASNIPRRFRGRYLGLTTTHTRAAFDFLEVHALPSSPAAASINSLALEPVDARPLYTSTHGALLNAALLGGSWSQEGDRFSQTDERQRVFALPTTLLGAEYKVGVDVTVPPADDEAAGAADAADAEQSIETSPAAGLLLTLQRPEELQREHLVLISNGGRTLRWYAYNEAGELRPGGTRSLEPVSGRPQRLEVAVSNGRVTIWVDGVLMDDEAWDVKSGGWVALASRGGPVTLEGLTMTAGALLE